MKHAYTPKGSLKGSIYKGSISELRDIPHRRVESSSYHCGAVPDQLRCTTDGYTGAIDRRGPPVCPVVGDRDFGFKYGNGMNMAYGVWRSEEVAITSPTVGMW